MAEHIPKHCSISTHKDELNEGECKNFNRNGMQGGFHRTHMRSLISPFPWEVCIAKPFAMFPQSTTYSHVIIRLEEIVVNGRIEA